MRESIFPKAEFQTDPKRAADHQAIVSKSEFKWAMELALLQYTMRVTQGDLSPAELSLSGLRIQGAREVLDILSNLGNINAHEPRKPIDQLDHL